MFRDTRKKTLRNRVIFMGLGVFIMTFGIWLNYRSETPAEETADVANKVSVEEESAEQEEEGSFEDVWEPDETDGSIEEVAKEEEDAEERTDTQSIPESYLIKEVEGVVKVFLCTQDGKEELYLITSIPFELLSESDQQMLSQGVKLETKEDLGRFLENFDS